MTTDDKESPPPLEFPDLLPLGEMTLPPTAKEKVAAYMEQQAKQPLPKPAVVEEVQPFVVIQAGFPRIAEAIHLMWGHAELEAYLHGLIVADRAGREGFPAAVHAALLKLYNQHGELFKFARPGDIWSPDPLARHHLK